MRKKEEHKTEREKVEERREEVLAKGRKFKYPLQYAKHRVILLTMIVAVVVIGALAGLGYLSLYKWNTTNDMIYRLTRVLPVSVAKIDGEKVRYSDYLLIYKSSITPIEKQQGKLDDSEDSENMRNHYKRAALTEAEDYAYAMKLARGLGITIDDAAVDKAIEEHRKVGGVERSQDSFEKIIKDNFDLSIREYRRLVYLSLVKAEVSKQIDTHAQELVDEVAQKLKKNNGDMSAIAKEMEGSISYEETGGLVDKMNVDGGRSAVAMSLEKGRISEPVISTNGDGYYFVKLIDKNSYSVNYASIKVPFEEFRKRVETMIKSEKVKERIHFPEEKTE